MKRSAVHRTHERRECASTDGLSVDDGIDRFLAYRLTGDQKVSRSAPAQI